jgi:hypothetical protein
MAWRGKYKDYDDTISFYQRNIALFVIKSLAPSVIEVSFVFDRGM